MERYAPRSNVRPSSDRPNAGRRRIGPGRDPRRATWRVDGRHSIARAVPRIGLCQRLPLRGGSAPPPDSADQGISVDGPCGFVVARSAQSGVFVRILRGPKSRTPCDWIAWLASAPDTPTNSATISSPGRDGYSPPLTTDPKASHRKRGWSLKRGPGRSSGSGPPDLTNEST